MTGMVGRKLGMTQIFDGSGRAVPVTVVEARPGVVVEVKTLDKHGYEAVKVGFFEDRKEKHYTKPELGMFKKAGVEPQRLLRESKGKGFQGGMKRHNFKGGPGGHGSMFNRAVGSIGSSATPSRVFKGKKMPGQMGSDRVTVKNLKVADVRVEQNLILLEGAVPGGKNSVVEIRKED
jgi:large subunit ribosomal protein L3